MARTNAFANRTSWLALVCGLPLMVGAAIAAEQPSESDILQALKSRGPGRAVGPADSAQPVKDRVNEDERHFLDALLKKKPRTVTMEERRRVADIARDKPAIDLEITFDYNSAVVGPQAVTTLVALGRALTDPQLASSTFLIGGHTDGRGGDSYNQDLSERRAEAVKAYLVTQFKLGPGHLLALGFGKSQLKNKADPFAGENRRVQVVNTE